MKLRAENKPNSIGMEAIKMKIDFSDTFATTNHVNNLDEISRLVFEKIPSWVESLLKFRNYLVQFMGLKVSKPDDYHQRFEVGGYVGFFKIFQILDHEIILGADDKHLNFRVSFLDTKATKFNIKITTLVQYNNKFGRLYMTIIKPFHVLIMKKLTKQAYNNSI